MGERIHKYFELSDEELHAPTILVDSKKVLCKNLLELREAIRSLGGGVMIALPDELNEGSRELAKARILASIPGVRGVVSYPEQVLKRFKNGDKPDNLTVVGEISVEENKVIFPNDNVRENAQVETTEDYLDIWFMKQAQLLTSESSCWYRPTACLFVRGFGVIATGVSQNSWGTDCKNLSLRPTDVSLSPGTRIMFCNAIHAEIDALAKAAKEGKSLDGTRGYVTTCPCEECAKPMIEAGVKKVVFAAEYVDREGVRLLKSNGIKVRRVEI